MLIYIVSFIMLGAAIGVALWDFVEYVVNIYFGEI